MIIRKDLLKEEMREDGYCPVVIRIHHNAKTRLIRTHIFTKEECWDTAICRINSAEHDCAFQNESLDALYRRVSGHIQNFIDTALDDNLDRILSGYNKENDPVEHTSTAHRDQNPASSAGDGDLTFLDLIDRKIASSVSLNTRRGYESFHRYVKRRMGTGPKVTEVNQDFTNLFTAELNEDYRGRESMRRLMISRYNAVVNFGRETGLISKAVKISLPPFFLLPANRNLSGEEICNIFSAYNEALTEDPEIKDKRTEALGLFILDIAFQGLAPVDLANLKVKSINFMTLHAFDKNPLRYLEDEEYRRQYDSPQNRLRAVTLSTTRKKTGRPVQVISSALGIEKMIRIMIKDKNPDDYFLPCYDHATEYSPEQRQNRLANYFNKMARYLNRGIAAYYQRHDLGECRRVTFYFARHAFCNLVDNMDIPRHLIQNMVGHRSTVLETSYLRPISPWEQAKISHKLLSRYFKD